MRPEPAAHLSDAEVIRYEDQISACYAALRAALKLTSTNVVAELGYELGHWGRLYLGHSYLLREVEMRSERHEGS
jgi:hypothetical protein